MSYRPTGILTDCGNGYGVALVRDGDGAPVRAGVDLNPGDETPNPRIYVDGAWVDVDAAFAAAYRIKASEYAPMTSARSLSAESRTTSCREINGGNDPTAEPGVDPGGIHWMAFSVPLLAGGLFIGINKIARSDLLIASSDPGAVGTGLELAYGGTLTLYTTSVIPMTRRADTGWWAVVNGGSLAAGLGLGIYGLTQNGRGTADFTSGLNLASTGTLGLIYGDRHDSANPARFYPAFSLQAAMSATGFILFFTGVGSRPTVSGRDMYPPEGLPPGSRDVPGNPYESSLLPAANRDFMWWGIANLAGATINMVDYQVSTSSGSAREGRSGVTVRAAPMTLPGGGGLTFSGTF